MIQMYVDGTLIWEAGSIDDEVKAYDPILTDEFLKVPTLKFTIPKTNAGWNLINPITSRIWVKENGSIIFYGRPLTIDTTFDQRKAVLCESSLGFMRDIQIKQEVNFGRNAVQDALKVLFVDVVEGSTHFIQGYNSLCDAANKIYLDEWFSDETRTSAQLDGESGARSSLDAVWTLAKKYNCAVWASWAESGSTIIPYFNFAECALMEEYPLTPLDVQQIKFGRNLISLDEELDTTGVFTRIYAHDTTNDVWYSYQNDSHVAAYGKIVVAQDFDVSGYSDASAGRTAEAQKYYNANAYPILIRSVKAVDAVNLGANYRRFRVGWYYDVVSPPHGINERMMCQRIVRNLEKPGRDSYEFGQVKRTLTERLVR